MCVLLSKSALLCRTVHRHRVSHYTQGGMNALATAVESGHTHLAVALLEMKADPRLVSALLASAFGP
jgi:hypothetical protein